MDRLQPKAVTPCAAFALLAFLALHGCATIEPSTPQLSAEIGNRISDLQGAHEQAVRRYFAAERKRVEDFFNDVWMPQFLRNFVEKSGIVKMVGKAPAGDPTDGPDALMIEWAQDAQHEIDRKRCELLAPLDEAEQSVLGELTDDYTQLNAAQAMLTARLRAAADLKGEQDQLLKDFGANKTYAAVKQRLTQVSAAVGSALSAAEGQGDSAATAKVLGEKLREEIGKTLAERPTAAEPAAAPPTN